MGHKGILFTGEPQSFGQPLLGDQYWNPLWETSVELDLPISFHVGSGSMELGLRKDKVATYGRMAAFTELSVEILLRKGIQLSDLIMSGVLTSYSKIKFVYRVGSDDTLCARSAAVPVYG
jgi:predicted TIM-barrel fold metal-dependent hydrolase